jgi:hypothetical protein
MAEFIINGPEGQSTLNAPAWATEATQVNISKTLAGIGLTAEKSEALLKLMFKGYEGVTKATKEGDKEIADLLAKIDEKEAENLKEQKTIKQATKAQTKAFEDLEKLQSDSLDELGKLNQHTSQQNNDLDKILKDMNAGGEGMMSFAGGMGKAFSVLGIGLKAVTGMLALFGTAILGAATYITSQFKETFQFLNNGLKQGTGGIIGLTHPVENVAIAANLAGMSLEEFGTFAQQNSKILRQLGARGFADLYSKTLLASGGLLDIGMTAEDAVESVMTELEYRRRFGMVLNQDTASLRTSLMTSARELRIFANAVGMSEDELRSQREISEQHVDLLQLQAKAMGANTDELIQNTQRISGQMAAAGLSELINPLFEAISKGSTGLSDEFIEIGKTAPEIIKLIEDEAANFRMTGELNANLSKDMFDLFRNLSEEQERQIIALAVAGDAGAVSFNNLRKNINRLSDETIGKVFGELDDTSLSMLDTFNRLGYVVNQGTSAIGDMGKTAILAALGFDDAGSGTFDFNAGIKNMSNTINNVVENIFGYNNGITDATRKFTDYMSVMFGGQGDDSKEVYEAKLEEARLTFTNTISAFSQKLGLDLNKQLQEGTLFDTIKRFFIEFFEDLQIALNKASFGVLFGDAADRVAYERFRRGDISNQEYIDSVGTFGKGDREAIRNVMFEQGVRETASSLGISEALSGVVTSGIPNYGDDNRHSNIVMDDLRDNVEGFDFMTQSKQKELFNARVAEVAEFNANVLKYVDDMKQLMEDSGLDYSWNIYIGDEQNYNDMLEELRLSSSINAENLGAYKRFGKSNTQFGDLYGQSSEFLSDSAYAQLSLNTITKRLQNQGGMWSGKPGILNQIGGMNYNNANTLDGPVSIADTKEFQNLRTLYNEAVADGRMDYDKEFPGLMQAMNALEKETKSGLDKDGKTQALLTELRDLIKVQKQLTNSIKEKDNND